MGQPMSTELASSLKRKGYQISDPQADNQEVQTISGVLIDATGWKTFLLTKANKSIHLISKCPAKAKMNSISVVNEFLTRINFPVLVGCFEVDFKDGEVQLRTSIPIGCIQSPAKLVISTFDRHVSTLSQRSADVLRLVVSPPDFNDHIGVTCDGCLQAHIKGPRFKCKTCKDYDLCSGCKAKKIHNGHPFVRYSTPTSSPVDDLELPPSPSPLPKPSPLQQPKPSPSKPPQQPFAQPIVYPNKPPPQPQPSPQPKPEPAPNNNRNRAGSQKIAKDALGRMDANKPIPIEPGPLPSPIPMRAPDVKLVPVDQIVWARGPDDKRVKLGKGGFATVYKAKWHGLEVAVKVINMELAPDMKELFEREIMVMAALKHPHIVLMLGVCDAPPCVILPFMHKGNLQSVIMSRDPVPMATKLRYLIDSAKGMAFVHGNFILHGDIKPLNILIDRNDVAYVADFGLSKLKASMSSMNAGTRADGMSVLYTAPEVFQDGRITPATDVYAFAILMWCVITTQSVPFNQFRHPKEIEKAVIAGIRPNPALYSSSTPQSLRDLISECWHPVPSKRPSFISILDRLERIAA